MPGFFESSFAGPRSCLRRFVEIKFLSLQSFFVIVLPFLVVFDQIPSTRYQDFSKVPLLGHGVASGGFLRSGFCHPKVFFYIILYCFAIFVDFCQCFPKWVPSKEGQTASIPNGLGPQPISRTQGKINARAIPHCRYKYMYMYINVYIHIDTCRYVYMYT